MDPILQQSDPGRRGVRVDRHKMLRVAHQLKRPSPWWVKLMISEIVHSECRTAGVPRYVADPATLAAISRLVELDLEVGTNPGHVEDRTATGGRSDLHRHQGANDGPSDVGGQAGPGVPKRTWRVVRSKR